MEENQKLFRQNNEIEKGEQEMLASILSSGVNILFAIIILTPVLIMLGMCVIYFLFDAFQSFRRRHPM